MTRIRIAQLVMMTAVGIGLGASANAAPLLDVNFDSGIPATWTTTNTGPVSWQLNTATGLTNYTGGTGTAASADSFAAGAGAYDASLLSPTVTLPGSGHVSLQFLTDIQPWSSGETFDVDVKGTGGTWTNLIRWQGLLPDQAYTGTASASLDPYLGQNVQLRWRYYDPSAANTPDNYWMIDNVTVTPEPMTLGLLALGGLVVLGRRRRTA